MKKIISAAAALAIAAGSLAACNNEDLKSGETSSEMMTPSSEMMAPESDSMDKDSMKSDEMMAPESDAKTSDSMMSDEMAH